MQAQEYSYQNKQADYKPLTTLDDRRILRAVTAKSNRRYSKDHIVHPSSFCIRAGDNPAPMGPILPWTEWVHPEGAPYFYHPGSRIITDSYIRDGETLKNLQLHLDDIWDLMKRRALVLPETCDIFVQLDDDVQTCNYYVVNHECHTLYWLEEVDSEEIGLPQATCEAHQRHALAEEYWSHVEYFPHRVLDVTKAVSEIVDILTFGQGDQLTSDNSTFPYDAKQCTEFLNMIRNSRQTGQEFIWLIARIWTGICQSRFYTYFGQEYARLTRAQQRLEPQTVWRPFGLRALEFALFRIPEALEQELELLYIRESIYTKDWCKFISAQMDDWRQASLYATGVVIAHLILLQHTGDSLARWMALAGAMFGVASLITSSGLLQKYIGANKPNAAVDRLDALHHSTLGFQLAAAVFSLPRAFQTWSLLILPVHITFLGVANASHTPLIFIASLIFILSCVILARAVAAIATSCHDETNTSWWRRFLLRQPDTPSPV